MARTQVDRCRVTGYRKHEDQQVQPPSGVTARSRMDHRRIVTARAGGLGEEF